MMWTETPAPGPPEPSPLDPAGLVTECGFCGELAEAVATGKHSNGGVAYTTVLYQHPRCPAVDPEARQQRPQLLHHERRRGRLSFRRPRG